MTVFRLFCALAFAIAGLGMAQPALAQNITADPDSIASVIRDKGFQVQVSTDDDGDPMIRADGKGYKFTVFFYGCTASHDCTTLGLYSGWTGSSADVNKVNEWNRENRFGRAYIDKEGDPVIEMDIDLDDGGMSRPLFEDHIEFWMSLMSHFAKHIFD